MDLGLGGGGCPVSGSTSGIGLETARLLAAEGARVVVSGRDTDRVEAARADVGAELGVVADLNEPGAPEELVHGSADAVGPIDCLVNNVGEAYQIAFEDVSDRQ